MSEETVPKAWKYAVNAVTEKPCPLCMDGRVKSAVVFEGKGPYSGLCCAARRAVLVKPQSPPMSRS